jgi:hypothetical protein
MGRQKLQVLVVPITLPQLTNQLKTLLLQKKLLLPLDTGLTAKISDIFSNLFGN